MSESVEQEDHFAPVGRTGWQTPLDLIGRLFEEPKPTDLTPLAETILAQQQPDGGWKAQVGASGSDLDTSVLNHLALCKAIRRDTFADNPELLARMESGLARSWQHVAGKVPKQENDILRALPGRVVRHLSNGPALMHETLLGHALAVRMDRQKCLDAAAEVCQRGADGAPLEAQPSRGPGFKTFATLAGVAGVATAAAAFPVVAVLVAIPVAQFVAGFVAGQINSSGNESYFHDKVLHASKALRNKADAWIKKNAEPLPLNSLPAVAEKAGNIAKCLAGKWINYAFYGHTKTHHAITDGKNYEEKLTDPIKRDKIMTRLERDGRTDLADVKFGSTTNEIGYLAYQVLALPSYAVATVAGVLLGAGPAFAAGFAIPSLLYPLYSATSYHDRVHTQADEALKGAPPLMAAYLKSWPSRMAAGHHFRHHVWRPGENRDRNYNLIPFPVGDKLRGVVAEVTPRQEEDMGDRGLLFW